MRAILLSEFGPPEVLTPTEVPEPEPGPGEVLVDVEFTNITFVETQLRAGRPPNPAMAPDLPVVPGNGVGGVVSKVGPDVAAELCGARVVTSTGGSGAYAERVAVAASGLILVPDGLGMAEAVALLADGRTATMLVQAAAPAEGETVLVEAAAGGVGSLLVQLAGNAGARVVGAAGEAGKLDLARELGAEVVVNYRDPGWDDRLRAELSNGVDVVFDGVGGEIGQAAFGLVRGGGRFLPFGMASGGFTDISGSGAGEGVTVLRPSPGTAEESLELTRGALAEAEAGRLHPVIGQRFPLDQAARAHSVIESRRSLGKTLLVVPEGSE